jgi:drug/metabolite transporter (DMT)-like permease
VFVFVLSVYFLGEEVTKSKIVALVLCMIGIIFITLFTHSQKEKDGQTHSSTPGGYIFCILSVVCYAVYEVFYAIVEKDSPIPEAERNDVMESFLFVGLMGCFNLILLLPGMAIVKAIGLEGPFEWPPGDVGGSIALVALLETGFHMFLLAGIAVKGPVFMAVGQILIIPTGYVYDAFQGGTHTGGNYAGVLFIISGFIVMQELPWTKQLIDKIAFRVCGMQSSDGNTLSGRNYSVLSDKQQAEELSSVM